MGNNDLSERTLAGHIDGVGDKVKGLGKRSKTRRAKRAPKAAAPADPAAIEQMYLQRLSSDLHARDRKGNAIPTLAERIRKEGVAKNMPRALKRTGKPAPKKKGG